MNAIDPMVIACVQCKNKITRKYANQKYCPDCSKSRTVEARKKSNKSRKTKGGSRVVA